MQKGRAFHCLTGKLCAQQAEQSRGPGAPSAGATPAPARQHSFAATLPSPARVHVADAAAQVCAAFKGRHGLEGRRLELSSSCTADEPGVYMHSPHMAPSMSLTAVKYLIWRYSEGSLRYTSTCTTATRCSFLGSRFFVAGLTASFNLFLWQFLRVLIYFLELSRLRDILPPLCFWALRSSHSGHLCPRPPAQRSLPMCTGVWRPEASAAAQNAAPFQGSRLGKALAASYGRSRSNGAAAAFSGGCAGLRAPYAQARNTPAWRSAAISRSGSAGSSCGLSVNPHLARSVALSLTCTSASSLPVLL